MIVDAQTERRYTYRMLPESRRVFIFGAGASREATKSLARRLPLTTEFFRRDFLGYHAPAFPSADSLRGFLIQYFGTEGAAIDDERFSHINVEAVYSFVTTSQAPHLFGTTAFESIREAVLDHIVWCVDDGARQADPGIYNAFVEAFVGTDTVVSFNWDTLLDRALTTSVVGKRLLESREAVLWPGENRRLTVSVDMPDRGVFLKPHGSTDLAICTNQDCARRVRPYRSSQPVYSLQRWRCESCGGAVEPYILPPHAFKSYSANSISAREASLLNTHLYFANEIVAFGFSFSEFDAEASNVFRLSRKAPTDMFRPRVQRLILVNPEVDNDAFVERVGRLFDVSDAAVKRFVSFEEYHRSGLLAAPQ